MSPILAQVQSFWNSENYRHEVMAEMEPTKPPAPIYVALKDHASEETTTSSRIGRLLQSIILPASRPLSPARDHDLKQLRSLVSESKVFKYKRISVEVEGQRIDAAILGRPETLNNGRWTLFSNGNGEYYEHKLKPYSYYWGTDGELEKGDSPTFKLLNELQSNAIVFNYPGVAGSEGQPNRTTLEKVYRAMLAFLEDKNQGIGASEVIGFAHSIGGGIQAQALQAHTLKPDVRYVFVQERTFSKLSTEASQLVRWLPLGWGLRKCDWELDTTAWSKAAKAPEIIVQSAHVAEAEVLYDSSKIKDDGVIPAKASLAKAVLEDPSIPKTNKVVIGISERHNDELCDTALLVSTIQQFLRQA